MQLTAQVSKAYYPAIKIKSKVVEFFNCLGCKLDLKKLVRGETGEKTTCPRCKGYNFFGLKPRN